MKDIKDKAEKSEQMVMEITKDIKSLDHAKKYLSTSIKSLKQLRMQISDVEQLKIVVPKRKYREIGIYPPTKRGKQRNSRSKTEITHIN